MGEIRLKADGLATSAPYVRALYKDMMGRSADPTGLLPGRPRWPPAAADGGSPPVSRSRLEYRRLVITQAYQRVLAGRPTPVA